MPIREETDALLRELDAVLRDTNYDGIRANRDRNNASSEPVNTELHQAALNLDWKKLHELKNKGIDPNLLDREGHTAEDAARNASLKAEKTGHHEVARDYRSIEMYLVNYRIGWEKAKTQRLESRSPIPGRSVSI